MSADPDPYDLSAVAKADLVVWRTPDGQDIGTALDKLATVRLVEDAAATRSFRHALLAAGVDHDAMEGRVPPWDRDDYPPGFREPLTLAEFEAFCQQVWSTGPRASARLIVRSAEGLAEEARARMGEGVAIGRWERQVTGLSDPSSSGFAPIAVIEVYREGLRRLVGLHEIAHLLCDTEDRSWGHGSRWVETYNELQYDHFGASFAANWAIRWGWRLNMWSQRCVDDQGYLPLPPAARPPSRAIASATARSHPSASSPHSPAHSSSSS